MLYNFSSTHETALTVDDSSRQFHIYEDGIFLSIIGGWLIGLISCCMQGISMISTDAEKDAWIPIGFIDNDSPDSAVLYERTYESGKKAWRYMHNNRYVYPRRVEVELHHKL